MNAPNYAYARQIPAGQLKRGDHVEFQGRWWLVDGADAGLRLVSVAMRENACACDQTMTQFGPLTVVWARNPLAQMHFAIAERLERRDLILDAIADRVGAAMLLSAVAA